MTNTNYMHIEINWSLKDIVKITETEIQIHYFNLSGPKTVKKIISLSLYFFSLVIATT